MKEFKMWLLRYRINRIQQKIASYSTKVNIWKNQVTRDNMQPAYVVEYIVKFSAKVAELKIKEAYLFDIIIINL